MDTKTSLNVDSIKEDIQNLSDNLRGFQHKDAINDNTPVKEIIPVIKIRDSIFAVKGDISIIGGLPKVGKTSVCAFILSTALMEEIPEGFDSLQIKSSFCQGKMVFYIDTEQPQAYTNKLRKQVLKLLGVSKHPPNLGIINLRKYDSETKLKTVLELMQEHPTAHLWIIDGVADLIKDPNDTKESFGIIEKFMMKSDELNTAIVLHIHENPGTSGKLRGNLGSEAERKCGGSIAIKKLKDKKCHAIEAKTIRGSGDFDPIFFRYDSDIGGMVTIMGDEACELTKSIDRDQVKREKRVQLAKSCLLLGSKKYGDLVESIISNAQRIEGKPIQKRTAETRIKDLIEMGIINLNGEFYAIADIYIPQP